jgi:Domain of unknown function (DUF4349)
MNIIRVLSLATLVSLTKQTATASSSFSSVRKLQKTTLGASFLSVAKNYTSTTTPPETKSGSFSASDLESPDIGPLVAAIDPLCGKFAGYYESKSRTTNEKGTSSYSVTCRFPANKFDNFEDAVIAALGDVVYTYSSSTYTDSYYTDPAIAKAQQKALENILVTADTIQDVILIVSPWQNVASSSPIYPVSSTMSSISISLSESFYYPPYPPIPAPMKTKSALAGRPPF